MISVKEAQTLIEKNCPKPRTEKRLVLESLGHSLTKGIKSPLHLPVFDNSAMDGYVFRSGDVSCANKTKPVLLLIKGVIQAGTNPQKISIRKGEAYRIMTGAPVPQGGDVVLPREAAVIKGKHLILDQSSIEGRHIRFQGEELKKGALVLAGKTVINPAMIGFLSMLGIEKVDVFSKPRVALIATGSELVKPGKKLKPGQIYDSNSAMIQTALCQMGLKDIYAKTSIDSKSALRKVIKSQLKRDIVILMGGVSVGDYDYVKEVLKELSVREIFWRVKQKPGKPLYFGKKGNTLFFGLPGNPASVYTCFYEYVYPVIRRMSGYPKPFLKREMMTLHEDVKTSPNRLIFYKAQTRLEAGERKVSMLRNQGSHMISSFCDADAMMMIPPQKRTALKGQKVAVDLLPGDF